MIKTNLFKAIAFTCSLLFVYQSFGQEILIGKDAQNRYPNAQIVRTSQHSSLPSFVKFVKGKEIDLDDFEVWVKKSFKLDSKFDLVLKSKESDQLGHIHYRYQSVYNGVPVEHSTWIAHSFQGKVYSMNGLIFSTIDESSASLTENTALSKALQHIDANVYKWELSVEENHLKRETGDPNATYYPQGELVYVSKGGSFNQSSYRLAYKFNIYAHEPVERSDIYVDAQNGEILLKDDVFHHADVNGTAETAYSGTRTIVADSFGGSYRLRETGRGNGINTYDMNEGTNYGNAVDFTDADNYWNNYNANQDEVATDAHWGAEMTYDYFWLEHNRNSIDNSGFELNSYVHYDNNYANAFWDGQRMTYGDGNSTYSPLTALDITGHEITHGLTDFTADLVYQAESGALNESFSDIFGTAIENYARPANWNWLVGEDIGSALRSMSNPNSYGDPDTYFGTNWASLTGPDNGGVHTNSGVQNFWYHLLVAGGSGTNDIGDSYNVTGIGFTDASAIAFRNLTVYLTASSEFADARFYAIQSAVDLFGGCTPEVEACTNAWYAVGVGPAYVSTVVADMTAAVTQGCSAPFTVDFDNLSINGTTFYWDFGDGNTSTSLDPSHTYSSLGDYTIQLIADGGNCGVDTTTWVDYISVDTANPCEVILPTGGTANLQTGCNGTVYDSGGPSSDYGSNEDAVVTIEPVGASTVDLDFVFFDIEAGASGSCNYDYLELYDGPNTSAPLIDKYCNNNIPTTVSSTGNAITIVFHSDPAVENGGFQINWNCNLSTVPPAADFSANVDTTCSGEVMFTDLSSNGPTQWDWNFGDGNTSTLSDPTHTYTASGLYTVSLTATNANGSDVATYTDLIYVDLPSAPVGTDDNICVNNAATLSASGTGGTLDWYDSPSGGTLVHSGPSYTTPPLSSTTSYYVEELTAGATQNLGPFDNTIGSGGIFNGDQHLVFDCTSPVTLKTVKVFASGAGDRFIELRDNTGNVIASKTVYIPDGEQVITLDFDLPVGTDLQLGTQPNSNQSLYRNDGGTAYPYTVGGGEVTITQASPGTGYYYFFYDWVIESPGCTSNRTQVTANVNPQSDATINPVSPLCSSDATVSLSAAESGGTWTGTGVSGSTFDPATAGVGTHEVIYEITGNCGDADTIDISVSDAYDATIAPTSVLCSEESPVQLTSADGGGVWSGSGITDSSNGTFDPSVAGVGTHSVTYDITGSCGDSDTTDIVVEESADASISTSLLTVCENHGVQQLSAVNTGGNWDANCTNCIDTNTGEFDPTISGAGTWTVTYSIGGNCPDTDTTTVVVDECLGINDQSSSIKIYPNPSNGQFIIEGANLNSAKIEVMDISGKIIYKNWLTLDKNVVQLSTQIAEGTYFVRIYPENNSEVINRKLQIISN